MSLAFIAARLSAASGAAARNHVIAALTKQSGG
jgi:hypothetical protein